MPALSPDAPLVTAAQDGPRQIVAAADNAARTLGIHAGMKLAQAQAIAPGLTVMPAAPAEDAAALAQLAAWCLHYAPLTAPDAPDGIWIDATGCTHLHGGERAMLADLVRRLASTGIAAHAAIADTPGAAHAAARFRGEPVVVVMTNGAESVLAGLPVAALRLATDTVDGLRRLGLERIGDLLAIPRAPLARRFGPEIALRLDQALGRVFEPIAPVHPPEVFSARLAFTEPLLTPEAFAAVIAQLAAQICTALENAGQGARRLDLLFERVDGTVQAIRIGTARPSRDARHLGRLLAERIEQVDPGLGVEAMRLVVARADPLAYAQTGALAGDGEAEPDVSALVDRLANRLGADHVYRVAPVESDVPERSVRRVAALAPPATATWPPSLPRPARLLSPPQPVQAMALLPDQPPVAFTWRRIRHRVRRADGPERITGEWWKRDGERRTVRDYFAVEDEAGRRYWLFRRGDGRDPATGDLRWFLHGMF